MPSASFRKQKFEEDFTNKAKARRKTEETECFQFSSDSDEPHDNDDERNATNTTNTSVHQAPFELKPPTLLDQQEAAELRGESFDTDSHDTKLKRAEPQEKTNDSTFERAERTVKPDISLAAKRLAATEQGSDSDDPFDLFSKRRCTTTTAPHHHRVSFSPNPERTVTRHHEHNTTHANTSTTTLFFNTTRTTTHSTPTYLSTTSCPRKLKTT